MLEKKVFHFICSYRVKTKLTASQQLPPVWRSWIRLLAAGLNAITHGEEKKGGLECVQCVAVSNIVIISTLPIPESLDDGKWVKCFEIINTLQPLSLFFECQRNLQSSTNLTRDIDNDTNNMRQREGENLVGDRKWELVGLWTDGRQSH